MKTSLYRPRMPRPPATAALLRAIMAGLLLVPASPANAPQAQVPAEPMSYLGGQWLERDDRDRQERSDRVLAHLELAPGMRVADLGTGTGFYARRFAAKVGADGVVYGIDIQPEMLALLEQKTAEEGVKGIVPVLSTPNDPKIPGPVDLVFLADVYHEIAEPLPVQQHVREALEYGGRVVLLEYRAEDETGDGIKPDHRMSVRQVVQEWGRAGFRLVELHTDLPSQHMIVLAQDDDPAFAEGGVQHHDLLEARAAGRVGLEISGDSETEVRLRVRNLTRDRLVLTAAAGTRFVGGPGTTQTEMLARRDLLVVVREGRSEEIDVAVIPRRWDRKTPGGRDSLEIRAVGADDPEARLMAAVQGGMFKPSPTVPRAYAPQTPEVERAAVWMVLEDAAWANVRDDLGVRGLPAEYAAAFGLALASEGGLDVTSRPVWLSRAEIFPGLQSEELRRWALGWMIRRRP